MSDTHQWIRTLLWGVVVDAAALKRGGQRAQFLSHIRHPTAVLQCHPLTHSGSYPSLSAHILLFDLLAFDGNNQEKGPRMLQITS